MLNTIIGEVLPLTIAIAISPLSIVAVVLMLLSPRAKQTGPGFFLGWLLGIAVPVTVSVLIAGLLPEQAATGGKSVAQAITHFVLAALMLLLALKGWRGRPKPGEDAPLPKWMSAIDSFTFGRALGLGLLLSGPRPKNLLIAASAGVIIGSAGLSAGQATIATAVFIGCAVSTVLIPVGAYFLAADRLRPALESLHRWLARENAIITTVLLTVMGALMLGKGIAAL
ncbi:GAP family protein [Leucobacter sp. BZR 635]